ncbi:hypothetical protein NGRA_2530 [Nosema granulosis]|uniref:MULE transposase domain-containing protein n=1 Tax=Nosema granulosis TaxID=83296 RepID=A0A9P6GWY1_9MICR|nr:hypothetical protein NGRA_2530 [Nosema granulosis]
MNSKKILALNSFLTHKEIVTKVKFELDLAEKKHLASSSSLFKHINLLRRENSISVCREDEEIPLEYYTTVDSYKFIQQYMPKGVSNRMIVICNDQSIKHLKYSELWLMDRTFKSCPFDFYQVHIIHASVRGKVYPFLYALLDRKIKSQYVELFEYVKMLIVPKNLKIIIVDFEKPCMEACEMVFPNVSV